MKNKSSKCATVRATSVAPGKPQRDNTCEMQDHALSEAKKRSRLLSQLKRERALFDKAYKAQEISSKPSRIIAHGKTILRQTWKIAGLMRRLKWDKAAAELEERASRVAEHLAKMTGNVAHS